MLLDNKFIWYENKTWNNNIKNYLNYNLLFLLMLEFDIIIEIFKYIEFAKDAYNFRLLNNQYSKAGLYYITNIKEQIYIRSTFVSMSCIYCYSEKYKFMSMPHDYHPRRCFYFCQKWKCQSIILCNLLKIFKNENIYPWVKYYPEKEIFPVLRSDGTYSKGKILNNYFYNIDNISYVNLLFCQNKFNNKNDVYNDESEFSLSKLCNKKLIDISYITKKRLFLSYLDNAKYLFIPYIKINLCISNKIKIIYKICVI